MTIIIIIIIIIIMIIINNNNFWSIFRLNITTKLQQYTYLITDSVKLAVSTKLIILLTI